MRTSEIGTAGELYARKQLEAVGYKIKACNFRSRFGEIDIIAEKEDTLAEGTRIRYLCFIEVKTRRDGQMTTGLEAVSFEKQNKIIKTAELYIALNRSRIEKLGLQPRFDCAEVRLNSEGRIYDFVYLENAFC